MEAHLIVIGVCMTLIISYLFNRLAASFNIPSIILLIATGIVLGVFAGDQIHSGLNIKKTMEVLGIIGLIIIVLEAALDLKLERSKISVILRSFFVSATLLLFTSVFIAALFHLLMGMDQYTALVYAIPLSVMSCAVIIPSVVNLEEKKREFMIYEATFSDILGIIFFYFLIDAKGSSSITSLLAEQAGKFGLTLIIAVAVSILLVLMIQRIRTEVKFFLMISLLVMLYAVGELLGLSSLLIILAFGLILNNSNIIFRGPLKKIIILDSFDSLVSTFKIITIESSFLIRTFFFILFGLTIPLSALVDPIAFLITLLILIILYGIRYLNLRFILRTDIYPQIFIAPRGLITILLFFSIPASIVHEGFNSNIILMTILTSSIIMMVSMMVKPKAHLVQDELDDEEPDEIIE